MAISPPQALGSSLWALDPTSRMSYHLINCQASLPTCQPPGSDCSLLVIPATGPSGTSPLFVSSSGWSMAVQSPLNATGPLRPGEPVGKIDPADLRLMIPRSGIPPFMAIWEGVAWEFEGLSSLAGENVVASVYGSGGGVSAHHVGGQISGAVHVQCVVKEQCKDKESAEKGATLYMSTLEPLFRAEALAVDGRATVEYVCLSVYWASFD
ncbi:hypothetical protein HK101_011672 [Irineochytrium annulatum]|nr:hypothetical protein HK101_011672 [Irineochytrium annulatum]